MILSVNDYDIDDIDTHIGEHVMLMILMLWTFRYGPISIGTRRHEWKSSTFFTLSGTKYQVLGNKYQVSGSKYQVSAWHCQVATPRNTKSISVLPAVPILLVQYALPICDQISY